MEQKGLCGGEWPNRAARCVAPAVHRWMLRWKVLCWAQLC